jgi:hypothetical protein
MAVIAALIEVAEGCVRRFKSQGLETNAADVMTMTGLVLDRARQRARRTARTRSPPLFGGRGTCFGIVPYLPPSW